MKEPISVPVSVNERHMAESREGKTTPPPHQTPAERKAARAKRNAERRARKADQKRSK